MVWDVMACLHFYFCAHYLCIYREDGCAHAFCAAIQTREFQMLSPGFLPGYRLTESGTATNRAAPFFLTTAQFFIIPQFSCSTECICCLLTTDCTEV